MLIETLSVREAHEQLPTVLERFRSCDRTPVGVGSHRKTVTVERSRSLAQATASVRAEGLDLGANVEKIMQRWTRGEVSTAEMRKLIQDLYGAS